MGGVEEEETEVEASESVLWRADTESLRFGQRGKSGALYESMLVVWTSSTGAEILWRRGI